MIIRTLTITCDHSDCDEFGYAAYSVQATDTEARREAAGDGWTYERGGKDFCPRHADSTDPTDH